MKLTRYIPSLFACSLLLAGLSFASDDGVASPNADESLTFVIVHGAWGGGWAFKEVERLLRANGHTVYRPTLTGQGEKVHLARPDIDLTTHVTDVMNVILWERLSDVVLVGHSYGGMVISGVVERVPERIGRVVYLDAFVPNDGESAAIALGAVGNMPGDEKDGFRVPPWVKPGAAIPHDVPHPTKTLTEPLVLGNPAAKALSAAYILTVDPGKKPEEDTFYRFSERAKARGWPVFVMEADHNPQRSKPRELVELLARAAGLTK